MGMFDDLRVLYPLPFGGRDTEFQTKDTHAQFCDQYELREDGTLWREAYDGGIGEHRTNIRWEQEVWTGKLCFYTPIGTDGWLEYIALMREGKLITLDLVEHKLPTR
jgi:hypothetical protein